MPYFAKKLYMITNKSSTIITAAPARICHALLNGAIAGVANDRDKNVRNAIEDPDIALNADSGTKSLTPEMNITCIKALLYKSSRGTTKMNNKAPKRRTLKRKRRLFFTGYHFVYPDDPHIYYHHNESNFPAVFVKIVAVFRPQLVDPRH